MKTLKHSSRIYYVLLVFLAFVLGAALLLQIAVSQSADLGFTELLRQISATTWALSIYFIITTIVAFVLIYVNIIRAFERVNVSTQANLPQSITPASIPTTKTSNLIATAQAPSVFVEYCPNEIATDMIVITRNNEPVETEPDPETLMLIENAREVVLNNIDNSDYNIDDFCNDLGLTRMQLYRKFKTSINMSANCFIRKVRLQKAAEMIETRQYSIKEITYDVGFTDLKYFRKCFVNEYGVPPSKYSGHHAVGQTA